MNIVSVNQFVDNRQTTCLNTTDEVTPLFQAGSTKILESDCDEQLLFTVTFQGEVKLSDILVTAPLDGRAPKTITIVINQPHLDFESVEDVPATQTLTISKEDYKPEPTPSQTSDEAVQTNGSSGATKEGPTETTEESIPLGTAKCSLKFVKFQRVYCITLFVVDNVGETETTAVARFTFLGSHTQHFNASELKKEGTPGNSTAPPVVP